MHMIDKKRRATIGTLPNAKILNSLSLNFDTVRLLKLWPNNYLVLLDKIDEARIALILGISLSLLKYSLEWNTY